MRISVITPSYNQARFLEATLRSVHVQGYPELEHIVIDGGSTDGSVEILERWSDRLAYWVSEPDEGQTDAIRRGFEIATGNVLCWLNSDDLYEPWTLREVGEWFASHPSGEFVYGDATWIDVDDRMLRPKKEHGWSRFVFLYDHDFIPQPSTFWTRDLYERVGGMDVRFDLAMDADLFARFSDVTKMYHVRRPWSRMRLYADQKNQRLRHQSNLEDALIRDRYSPGEPRWAYTVKRGLARSLRITWKAATGCYGAADLRRIT